MRRLKIFLLTFAALAGLAAVANVEAGWLFNRNVAQAPVCKDGVCTLPGNAVVPAAKTAPAPIVVQPKGANPKAPYVPPNGVYPTGVVSEKLSQTDKYHQNGQEVAKEVAYQAIGGQSLIDDAAKPYVAIVDPDPKRRAEVVATIKHEMGDKVKVWDGPPDDWSYATGHKTDGRPTIYAQLPTGEVKHRQDEMADGIENAVGAVRKAFPDYNPAKDPDLRKPQAPAPGGGGLLDLSNLRNQIALALAAFMSGLVAFFKAKQPAAA